jgi:chorismate lyase/3-hydroxybenzoate synthase
MAARPEFLQEPVVEYRLAGTASLSPDVLGAVAYGGAATDADPRWLRVGLETPEAGGVVELWRGSGPVDRGTAGPIRYAASHSLLFGILEVDERQHGGLRGAAAFAYRALEAFHRGRPHRHLLRMWSFMDAINAGDGDAERYKQFCLGRAEGFGRVPEETYPAATAVGRRDGEPTLQVCWIAGRTAGQPVENPRQVQAYRYPRRYGPSPPSFCRAIVLPQGPLLVSGTASIVGSESMHGGDLGAQLDETVRNLQQVLAVAHGSAGPRPVLPAGTVLKTYLRDLGASAETAARLGAVLGPGVSVVTLGADICREELSVEMECVCAYGGSG